MIAGASARGEDVRHESQDKSVTTVRVEDIPKTVQLIGRLNHPLGDLLTIRGQWKMPSGMVKDPTLWFHVTSINGKKPEKKVALNILQVKPAKGGLGRELKPGDPWAWMYGFGGKQPAPTPAEGEVWEMMGVETGSFKHYSTEANRQIGWQVKQMPMFLTGFVTNFEFIAVKKIQKPRQVKSH
jgi:hypothetical protein